MSITVEIDFKAIDKKFSDETRKKAVFSASNQLLKEMERYVPFRSGSLRASGKATDNGVVYNTPYARAQFYGNNGKATFKVYRTVGTGKRWDLRITNEQLQEITKKVVDFYSGGR